MLRTPRETDAQKTLRLRLEELNGATYAPAKPGFFAELRKQRISKALSDSVEHRDLVLEDTSLLRP
jgi:hypothetical protein